MARRATVRVSELKKVGDYAHEKEEPHLRLLFFVGVDGFEPPTLCL